jgi:SSS family solute:Na+ symporter
MTYGTITAYNVVNPATGNHFGGSLANMPVIGELGYIALTAFAINVVVAGLLTFILNAMKVEAGADTTIKGDYFADEGDPRVEKHLDTGIHLQTGAP